MTIMMIFLVLALVCFLAAAAAVEYSVRLLPLGLAFCVVGFLLSNT